MFLLGFFVFLTCFNVSEQFTILVLKVSLLGKHNLQSPNLLCWILEIEPIPDIWLFFPIFLIWSSWFLSVDRPPRQSPSASMDEAARGGGGDQDPLLLPQVKSPLIIFPWFKFQFNVDSLCLSVCEIQFVILSSPVILFHFLFNENSRVGIHPLESESKLEIKSARYKQFKTFSFCLWIYDSMFCVVIYLMLSPKFWVQASGIENWLPRINVKVNFNRDLSDTYC